MKALPSFGHQRRTLSTLLLISASLWAEPFLSSVDAGHVNVDGAFVTRRGATVQGTLEAGVVALGENASVAVERGANVHGSIMLRAEKAPRRIDLRSPIEAAKVSSRVSVVNRGGKEAVKGETRAVDSFELPHIDRPSRPVKGASVVIEGSTLIPADFSSIGNITLKKPGVTVILPPGAYGDIVVGQGSLVLGIAAARNPARYELRSLEVGAGGRVEIAGPVAVTVEAGGVWRGAVGNPAAPMWLDLRIAGGDVTIAGAGRVDGLLTAPLSKISLSGEAILVGGVISDQLDIGPRARAKALVPDWTAEATELTRPRFPHKALRLEANIPALSDGFQHSFYPGVTYINDTPFIMMSEGNRPREHPMAAFEELRAFFETCCSLFTNTGFERGGIVMAGYAADSTNQLQSVRNVMLTREFFETEVARIGGKETSSESIEAIAMHPQRLAEFQERMLASVAQGAGAR